MSTSFSASLNEDNDIINKQLLIKAEILDKNYDKNGKRILKEFTPVYQPLSSGCSSCFGGSCSSNSSCTECNREIPYTNT